MAISGEGRQVVTTAGTRVQVVPVPGVVHVRVDVSALKRNTDDIYIGMNRVSAVAGRETGHVLEPGDTLTLNSQDLSNVWIDANLSGEGVMWMAYDNDGDG
ncbi:hypothetical protein LCGC14_1548520 [marine sediment metagenome]|uniref:Uncharacterized protein n=1 Tax=marine sediment metagenome TaxID=412755 RepID=A0A0F9IR28_9ZZZZ